MTDESGFRVRDLLPDRFDDMDKVVAEEMRGAEVSEAGGPGDGQAGGLSGFAMKMAGDRVAKAVKDTLDCDLFETLAKAWQKASELHEYTDPKKHPPGERSTVFLGDHKLSAKLHPVLDVKVAALGHARLRFTVELKAKFRCADLTIMDGRIVEIGAGDCQATAQLKYRDTNLHKEMKSRQVTLTQPRTLPAPGLPIL